MLRVFFKSKRPGLLFQDWFSVGWDNSPGPHCHPFPGGPGGESGRSPHSSCSLDIAPGHFFLFPKGTSELADFLLSQDSSKTRGVRILRTITKNEFVTAFKGSKNTATCAFGLATTTLRKVEK
jgi:hypothetical protein